MFGCSCSCSVCGVRIIGTLVWFHIGYLVPSTGTWYQVSGTWYLVPCTSGTGYQIPSTRCLETSTSYQILGTWYQSDCVFQSGCQITLPDWAPECCSQSGHSDGPIAFPNRPQSVDSAQVGRLGARWPVGGSTKQKPRCNI